MNRQLRQISKGGGTQAATAHRLWQRPVYYIKYFIEFLVLTAKGKTVRTTFDSASSSDYVLCTEFAYKLIKTTQELLQETDSGNDVKFHFGGNLTT